MEAKNVLGGPLKSCCENPLTGFFRDGYCRTDDHDRGRHVVCAVLTDEFLDFTLQKGNDLRTARLEFQFPGLKANDQWCLCALRWREAFEAGCAPLVLLESTHEKVLEFVSLEDLKQKELK